jgi:hypothetical protein
MQAQQAIEQDQQPLPRVATAEQDLAFRHAVEEGKAGKAPPDLGIGHGAPHATA